MEYKYKINTEVFLEDGGLHIVDGKEEIEDLMITYWTPLNFEGETFNFLLRDNHVAWVPMHNNFFKTVERAWIDKLNFDEQYFFEELSRVTENNDTIVTNNIVKLDIGSHQEIETSNIINKHDEPDTDVGSL
tara:strand:+ start:10 stop:405 length:396 start_codon:yes stop_codon:yes gene_type:complete